MEPTELPTPRPELKCPQCGSDNVQSLRVLYELGSTTSNSTSLGVATTGRALGVGVAETAGKQQTLLAQRCAPSKKPEIKNLGCVFAGLWGLFAFIIVGMPISRALPDNAGAAFLTMIAAISVGIWFYHFYRTTKLPPLQEAHNKAMESYIRAMARWERSYHCSRCGESFEWRFGERCNVVDSSALETTLPTVTIERTTGGVEKETGEAVRNVAAASSIWHEANRWWQSFAAESTQVFVATVEQTHRLINYAKV